NRQPGPGPAPQDHVSHLKASRPGGSGEHGCNLPLNLKRHLNAAKSDRPQARSHGDHLLARIVVMGVRNPHRNLRTSSSFLEVCWQSRGADPEGPTEMLSKRDTHVARLDLGHLPTTFRAGFWPK